MAVATFARQVVADRAVFVALAGERYALADQPVDDGRPAAHDKLDGFTAAQPGAGVQGVRHVGFKGVLAAVQDGGDAALRVKTRTLGQGRLGDDRYFRVVGQPEGEAQPGRPPAEDQYIASEPGLHLRKGLER